MPYRVYLFNWKKLFESLLDKTYMKLTCNFTESESLIINRFF